MNEIHTKKITTLAFARFRPDAPTNTRNIRRRCAVGSQICRGPTTAPGPDVNTDRTKHFGRIALCLSVDEAF